MDNRTSRDIPKKSRHWKKKKETSSERYFSQIILPIIPVRGKLQVIPGTAEAAGLHTKALGGLKSLTRIKNSLGCRNIAK